MPKSKTPPTAKQLQDLADTFDWDHWAGELHDAMRPHYVAIAVEQGETEAERYDFAFDAQDPFTTKWFTGYLADAVSGISDVTRDKVKRTLQQAVEDGATDELADRLRDSYAFSPARANTIARTTAATAYGHGAGLSYRQNGIEQVEISDGDDDDECADADGQIWDLDEYLAEPIAHPNCVRAAAPVLPDDTNEGDEDDEE